MLHEDLPIYKTAQDLLNLALHVQVQIRKEFKHTLGRQIPDMCARMLVLMARANASKHEQRAYFLEEILMEKYTLTALFRAAFDMKLIGHKLWGNATLLLKSIGDQAGGWLKKTMQGDARQKSEGQGSRSSTHFESGCAAGPQAHRQAHQGNRRPMPAGPAQSLG